jgi:hypothetical protein
MLSVEQHSDLPQSKGTQLAIGTRQAQGYRNDKIIELLRMWSTVSFPLEPFLPFAANGAQQCS